VLGVYVARRLALLLPVVIIVSFLVYGSIYLAPGNPVSAIVGNVPLTPAAMARLRVEYGFNQPFIVQYLRFLGRAAEGNLGYSYASQRPVVDLILQNLPSTVELMLTSMAFGIVVGGVLGSLAARHPRSWLGTTATGVATVGLSLPSFWVGLLLLLAFSVELHLLPAFGNSGWQSLVLPTLTLGIVIAAVLTRFTRSAFLDVLRQDYITTARAKGVPERTILWRHALRNAAIPVLSIVGLQVGTLLAGAVVVETIYTREGIGRLLINSITGRDFPVLQGTVMFITVTYVCVNLLVDIAYTIIDPRIRHQGRRQ
jgi:peptide/nickel transport system permease protein